jgi:hypothetical protein
MSELHVRQIRANLEKVFKPLIDLSDVSGRPAEEQANCLLTRALAAFALAYLANIKPEDAAKAVTDGWHDNGLDAVYYHPADRVLYLVQSKWRHDGSGTIDRGEIQKFLKGFRDLLNARWERFNAKVAAKSHDLDAVLDDASTRIVLLIVYTGQEGLSQEVSQDLRDVIDEINDPTELVSTQILRQADVYSAVAQGLEGAPIDVDVALYDWGQVREPYLGFYGQVSASDVAVWFGSYQNRLLAPNIRMFLGATEVNETIVNTLLTAPQDFWYFNNGVTALCRTIQKKPIGGNTRETGFFECHDLRIVNGAQTVGAIAQAAAKDADRVAKARVAIRLIALESCPSDFDKQVTRYTNTQNRIDRRDFVALDIEQERIRGELQLEGVTYVYKSGETQPATATGFDLVEATIARACLQSDAALAVQAKREIGKLWDDIEKPPYKILFNPSVAGPALWRAVQVVRQVDQALATLRSSPDGRRRLLSVHGNRFVTHVLLACLPNGFSSKHQPLSPDEAKTVQDLTVKVFDEVLLRLNELYPDAYLASLFKNATKCQALKAKCSCPPQPAV